MQVYCFHELATFASLQPLGLEQILNSYPLHYRGAFAFCKIFYLKTYKKSLLESEPEKAVN
jgi:hypothetical protein